MIVQLNINFNSSGSGVIFENIDISSFVQQVSDLQQPYITLCPKVGRSPMGIKRLEKLKAEAVDVEYEEC